MVADLVALAAAQVPSPPLVLIDSGGPDIGLVFGYRDRPRGSFQRGSEMSALPSPANRIGCETRIGCVPRSK